MSSATPRIALANASDALATLCESMAAAGTLVHVGDEAPVDVLLLEVRVRDDAPALLADVRQRTVAPVVMLSDACSQGLVEWAAAAGIADVVAAPYDAGRVLFSVQKAIRAALARPVGRPKVVTVFSPKGGSGKTVLSVNLASAIARRGARRTLLVDLDLQFGDAAIMLDLEPVRTLLDVAGADDLDGRALAGVPVTHSSGLEVLPAPLHPEEAELITPDAVRSVIRAAKARYDVTVVDTSPFFHESTLAALDETDELLVVSTPEITTVKNVRLALETLGQLTVEARVRVVLNRAGERGGMSAGDVAAALGRDVDFVLPFDAGVPSGVNRGRPAALVAQSEFAAALSVLVRGLFPEDWTAVPQRRRTLFRRVPALAELR